MYKQGEPLFLTLAPWYAVSNEVTFLNQTISHDDCVVTAIRDPPVRAIRVGHVTGRKDGESGGVP